MDFNNDNGLFIRERMHAYEKFVSICYLPACPTQSTNPAVARCL